MRCPAALILLLGLTFAACDGAEPASPKPKVPSGPGEITAARAFADTTLDAGRDVVIDLAGRIVHNKGLPLRFTATADGPALAARLDGSRLTLVPALNGAATITVQAVAGDGTVREFAFRVGVVIADRIEAVAPSPSTYELIDGVPKNGPAAGRLFRQLDGLPLTFSVVSSAPGTVRVGLIADTVRLVPLALGTATVTVTAYDRGVTEQVALTVTVVPEPPTPCPAVPDDLFDALPFQPGQTIRFSVVHSYSDAYTVGSIPPTRVDLITSFRGTLTWEIMQARCGADGSLALGFVERVRGVQTTGRLAAGPVVVTDTVQVDEARPFLHTITINGGSILGRHVGYSSRFVPRATGVVHRSGGGYQSSVRADARGLLKFTSYESIRGGSGGRQTSEIVTVERLD